MKLFPNSRQLRGFSIIDCMVYAGVFVVVMGLAYFALYRCLENLKHVRRNSNDITRAVNAGEVWRGDIRAAKLPIQFDEADQTLRLTRDDREVSYRFADGQLLRRPRADAPWAVLIDRVQNSNMTSDPRSEVTAWRWDVELQTKQKNPRVKPLFTFIAAPTPS